MGQFAGCFFNSNFALSMDMHNFAVQSKRNGALLGSNSARNKAAPYA